MGWLAEAETALWTLGWVRTAKGYLSNAHARLLRDSPYSNNRQVWRLAEHRFSVETAQELAFFATWEESLLVGYTMYLRIGLTESQNVVWEGIPKARDGCS